MGIVHAFLASATHDSLDVACLAEARRPPFALEPPD